MKNHEKYEWQGKPIISPEHADHLESTAAVYEFSKHIPRPKAEAMAYRDYLRQHAFEAAAHHFLGAKVAIAANDKKSAAQHGAAYHAIMEFLGLDPFAPPPDEVKDATPKKSIYKFQSHPADSLIPGVVPEKA